MSAIWDARKCGAIVIFKDKDSYDVGLCTWTLLGPEIDLELMYTHSSESRTVRLLRDWGYGCWAQNVHL